MIQLLVAVAEKRDVDAYVLLWATVMTDLTLTIGGMLGIITWIAKHDKKEKEKNGALRR